MPGQQKPFSLYEIQFFFCSFLSLLALGLLFWHKKISPSQDFVSVLSGDLSQKLITICQSDLILCTFLARSQGVQTYDIQYPECVLTLFMVLFPVRKTFVSLLAFFPVFILDLVDLLSKSQQMPAEPCCSITVPLYPHCLGPVTIRAHSVLLTCVRVTVSAVRGESHHLHSAHSDTRSYRASAFIILRKRL